MDVARLYEVPKARVVVQMHVGRCAATRMLLPLLLA